MKQRTPALTFLQKMIKLTRSLWLNATLYSSSIRWSLVFNFIPFVSFIHHIARGIFVQHMSDHVSPCHIPQSDGSSSLQYVVKTPSTHKQVSLQGASHQPFQFNLLLPPSRHPRLNPQISLAFLNSLCFPLASALYMPASLQLTMSYLSFKAHL